MRRKLFYSKIIKKYLEKKVGNTILLLGAENLDKEIVARLYVASTDVIMGGEVFPWPEFRFDEVFIETLRFHIRGMANESGIIYLQERIKKEKNV